MSICFSKIAQERLLTFLQAGRLPNSDEELNVRILSSVSGDLSHKLDSGKFSKDLYQRLNICELYVPPLSKRREDIGILVDNYVEQISKTVGVRKLKFSEEALCSLADFHWIAHLSQLKNMVEWVLLVTPSDFVGEITPEMLPFNVKNSENFDINDSDMLSMSLKQAREMFEKKILKFTVEKIF